MTQLLEIKEKIIKFYSCYENYLNIAVKFIVALGLFLIINTNIGYMERISSFPIAFVLALVCCLLPQNATVLLAGLVVLLHLYALSVETAVVGLVLLLIIYLMYFRFTPKDGLLAVLTPLCFKLNIPYIMPIGGALLRPISSQIAVICGTVFYYFLHGINQNAPVLSAAAAKSAEEEGTGSLSGFNVVIGQLTDNKEMLLAVGIFAVTGLVVYFVRRIKMDYSWTIAIVSGVLIQIVGFFVGYLFLNVSGKTLWLILGNLISLLLGWILQFFFMNLDYARTERVQFQDDEYYYYVRAVPKKMVATQEKTVKRFGNTASMGKRIDRGSKGQEDDEETSRRVIARELNIDEDLLK